MQKYLNILKMTGQDWHKKKKKKLNLVNIPD